MTVTLTLTTSDGRSTGIEFSIDGHGQWAVGRGSDCDLQLPAGFAYLTISRRHCLLDVGPAGVTVRDCGSRNGTLVNGVRLAAGRGQEAAKGDTRVLEVHELRQGDRLQLGSVTFRVDLAVTPCRGRCDLAEPSLVDEIDALCGGGRESPDDVEELAGSNCH